MSRPNNDTLSRYLNDLRSRNEAVRQKAAKNLRIYVEAEAREMSRGTFSNFMTETTKRIDDLVSSSEAHEKIGGIMAIDELIEVPCEDNEAKIVQFANYLRKVFQHPKVECAAVMQASRALGHLARAAGTVTADFIDFELRCSVERLKERTDGKRYTAVLVLKELATNSPVLFSPFIPTFFEHIWVAIHSAGAPYVREAAVDALRAVLVIVVKRGDETCYRHEWFEKISEQMQEGFRIAEAASIHGSLLVIGELLRNTGNFMQARFADTCKIVFAYKLHRDRLVKRTTIQLLPQLAHFCPAHFLQGGRLESCVTHLIHVLRSGGGSHNHYPAAFEAVGEIALAVGPAISPYTQEIIGLVNGALTSQSKWGRHSTHANEALHCMSKLAKAVGPSLGPQIESLVDKMFAAGLSQPLLEVLGELACSTPSLLPAVQSRLLSCIIAMLEAHQKGADGSPGQNAAECPPAADAAKGVLSDEEAVALALGALRAFGAEDPRARAVAINNTVVWYFDHESPLVRREAALTVTKLLLPSPERMTPAVAEQLGGLAVQGSQQCVVLCQTHQLLAVAQRVRTALIFCVSDPDPPTRRRVFESFDQRFDPFLCEQHCVGLLAQALHDEDLAVRKAVIQIMGRLSLHNPAYVVPALRKLLIQILTELEYSIEVRHKEEATEMISSLSLHAHSIIEPYVGAIAKKLLQRLKDATADGSLRLTVNLFHALGELSEVSGQEIKPFLPDLIPLLVDAIQDHSGPSGALRRERVEQACRTLRMVVENTGHVTELYEKCPSLLPFLIDSLRSDVHTGDWRQRQQILRCIGALGALDPSRFHQLANSTASDGPVVGGGADGPVVALLESETKAQTWPWLSSGYYFGDNSGDGQEERPNLFAAHAVAALLKMLSDTSLTSQHSQVVTVLMKILKSLDQGRIPFLPPIMAAFLQVIRSQGPSERQGLLRHLAELVHLAGPRIGDYLESMFEVVASVWRRQGGEAGAAAARGRAPDGAGTTMAVLLLLEEISRCHRDALKAHLGELLPTVLGLLHQNSASQRGVVRQVLHSLVVFGHALADYLHLVIPALVRRFEEDEEDGDNDTKEDEDGANGRPDGLLEASATGGLGAGGLGGGAAGLGGAGGGGTHAAGGSGSPSIREGAIRALGALSTMLHFPNMLGRVVHPLLRILDAPTSSETLKRASIDTLGQLRKVCSKEFAIFEPQVRRVMARHSLASPNGVAALPAATAAAATAATPSATAAATPSAGGRPAGEAGPAAEATQPIQPNQHSLRQAWEASHPKTKDDWVEWMRRLTLELLRESASPALRACFPLAQVYYPLSKELFHVSFLSSWLHLYDPYRDLLIRSLETALHAPNLPPDILQALLDLAEFMDRLGLPLPTDARTLGGLSEKCHAYAKALHYKETEFMTSPVMCVEALISINTQLQQTEAAQGILAYARKNLNVELREPWYERLQRWEDALEAYELRQLEDPSSLEWTRSRMRCLHELGEWPRLSQVARSVWMKDGAVYEDLKQETAPLAAAAEFHLRDWERMAVFVDGFEGSRNNSYEGFLYSAILAIHQENYSRASRLISRARETLDQELTALVGESYTRAYPGLVKVQQLTELEEIIKYKTTNREQTRRIIKEMWASRLSNCQYSVDVWQAALQIRSIVIPPTEDLDTWVRFGALCRRSSRLDLAVKALEPLRHGGVRDREDPHVIVAMLKNNYAAGSKRQACEMMRLFVLSSSNRGVPAPLLARCHLKMGLWTREVYEEENKEAYYKNESVLQQVLQWFKAAIDLNGDYKAWNAWALANFQAVEAMEAAALGRTTDDSPTNAVSKISGTMRAPWQSPPGPAEEAAAPVRAAYVTQAIQGFVQSVVLAKKMALQDILRLLMLWFKYAGNKEVEPVLRKCFDTTPLIAWLQVVPQILARLRSPNESLRTTIRELLARVAQAYPQAVVFPLTVATKSTVDTLASSTRSLLQGMQHAKELVQESEMVSQELIRISILWHERWYEALEDASRLYYTESDPEAMIQVLQPLHEQLQSLQAAQTMREIAFQQAFSRELQEAWRCVQRYKESRDKLHTEQAWQSYYKVYQKLRQQRQRLTHLDLQSVSPNLLNARGLRLAVPGTYAAESEGAVVTISSFSPSIEVVDSKQRPRILQVTGSDGRSYQFLLKGHEDLKQDERVMQLFGLINNLLEENVESAKRDLSIARFAVVPLSANSGLIEWVPRCDTLHQLIKLYRQSRHVELSVEYHLMRSVCSQCEDLSILQKVEVFRRALRHTSGSDLQHVLWLQSRNSEVWLSRRTTYCRSLAVMSVVGYILGLGDRHPSNLMIARESGQVVHIDFGDCFEIAAFREKYPEKIPFRLTRMLLNALEVSGVEGNYRYTCELVMSLLRSNRDAVMAMLEAFVFDPLITWRLLPTQTHRTPAAAGLSSAGRSFPAYRHISPLQPFGGGHAVARSGGAAQVAQQHPAGSGAEAQAAAADAGRDAAPAQDTTRRRPVELGDGSATVAGPGAAAASPAEAGAPTGVDDRPHPSNFPQNFADDEQAGAEQDPHLASVCGKQARQRELRQYLGPEGVHANPELLSSTARSVISRVYAKLDGTDFRREALDVEAQVERLFQEATSHENLCQCYVGWCPFW